MKILIDAINIYAAWAIFCVSEGDPFDGIDGLVQDCSNSIAYALE